MFNPATNEEVVIEFRIVDMDLTPLIGLTDSETLRLIEVLRDNIALVEPCKPTIPATAKELTTPLTLESILKEFPDVFQDSVGKLDGDLHLYTKSDVNPHKTAPREFEHSVKQNLISFFLAKSLIQSDES